MTHLLALQSLRLSQYHKYNGMRGINVQRDQQERQELGRHGLVKVRERESDIRAELARASEPLLGTHLSLQALVLLFYAAPVDFSDTKLNTFV